MRVFNILLLYFLAGLLQPVAATAQEAIDYQAMTEDGFGDIAGLLRAMSPEQQTAVLNQASARQTELERMSPEQLQQLHDQLQSIAGTIAVNRIDPQAINTKTALTTAQTQQMLRNYQQRYQQGTIHNAVIIPPTGQ